MAAILDEPDETGVHEEGKSEVVHLVRESLEPARHDGHTAEPGSHQCNYKANSFKFVLFLKTEGFLVSSYQFIALSGIFFL